MTDTQVRRFRDLLKSKQQSIEELLWRRDGIDIERSADPSDEAQFAFDRELMVRTLDHESSLLAAVNAALQRIRDGEYGVCQSCDGEISAKRLAAVPWALRCITCQEALDQTLENERFAAKVDAMAAQL
jgi:DnaK suppressor protein